WVRSFPAASRWVYSRMQVNTSSTSRPYGLAYCTPFVAINANPLARARSTSCRLICSSPRTKCRWSSTKTFSRPNASINVVAEMPVRLGLARDPFSPLRGEGEDEGFLDVEAAVPAAPELREGGSAAGFPL